MPIPAYAIRSMTRRLHVLMLAFLIPVWGAAADQCEHLVAIGVGERAPYHWQHAEDAQPQGASVALLRRMADELDVSLNILTAESREQAEREVISGRVDLLIDTRWRPELLTALDFLHPALHLAPIVAWVPAERSFPLYEWEELQGQRGLAVDAALTVDERLKPTSADDFALAIQSMLAGKHDFVLFDYAAGQVDSLRYGWVGRVEVLFPELYKQPLYLAFSHRSACNTPELRGRLAMALHRIESEAAAADSVRKEIRHWAEHKH